MNPIPDDELLSAYLDGELAGEDLARAERMLADQPESRQMLEELRALSGSLETLPRYRLEDDFAQRVLRLAEREMLLGAEPEHAPAAPSTAAAQPSLAQPTAPNPAAPASQEAIASRPSMALDDTARPDLGGRVWPRAKRPLLYAALAMAAGLLIMALDVGRFPPAGQADRQVAVAPDAKSRAEHLASNSQIGPAPSEPAATPSDGVFAKSAAPGRAGAAALDETSELKSFAGGSPAQSEARPASRRESATAAFDAPAPAAMAGPSGETAPPAPATIPVRGGTAGQKPDARRSRGAGRSGSTVESEGVRNKGRIPPRSDGKPVELPAPGGAGGGLGGGLRGIAAGKGAIRPGGGPRASGRPTDEVDNHNGRGASLDELTALARTAEPELMIVECEVADGDAYQRNFREILSRRQIAWQDQEPGSADVKARKPKDGNSTHELAEEQSAVEAGESDAFYRNADRLEANLRPDSLQLALRQRDGEEAAEPEADLGNAPSESADSVLVYVEVSRDQLEGLLSDLDGDPDVVTQIQVQPAPDERRQRGLEEFARDRSGKRSSKKSETRPGTDDGDPRDPAKSDVSDLAKSKTDATERPADERADKRNRERYRLSRVGLAQQLFPPEAGAGAPLATGDSASDDAPADKPEEEKLEADDEDKSASEKKQLQAEKLAEESLADLVDKELTGAPPLKALFIFRRAPADAATDDDEPAP